MTFSYFLEPEAYKLLLEPLLADRPVSQINYTNSSNILLKNLVFSGQFLLAEFILAYKASLFSNFFIYNCFVNNFLTRQNLSMLMLPEEKICYLLPLDKEILEPRKLLSDLDNAEVSAH